MSCFSFVQQGPGQDPWDQSLQATLALCFTQRKLLAQNIRSATSTRQTMWFYALYKSQRQTTIHTEENRTYVFT